MTPLDHLRAQQIECALHIFYGGPDQRGARLDWVIENHDSVMLWLELANRTTIDAARKGKL